MKAKVLILQNSLMQYRVPCWNILAQKYELTLAYYDKDRTGEANCLFNKVKLGSSQIGPFVFVHEVRKLASQNDVVIIMDDLHVPSYCLLPFFPRKYKVLGWGIGFRVSYVHPYIVNRSHGFVDKLNEIVMKKCDAYIFYMKKALEFWANFNFDPHKTFIAPNTAEVMPIEVCSESKRDVIFIGTLYKGKGVDTLIKCFHSAIENLSTDVKLIIIGGGDMKDELIQLTSQLKISDRVVFTGPIYDENVLASYFSNALISVSPLQGGLSCPKSMGYAVPFITSKNAITGGEIYHMTSGVNGIMYENEEELVIILKEAIINPKKYIEMGIKAKQYYMTYATPKHMAQGAIDAIEYSLHV